jgi:hypothetical protein
MRSLPRILGSVALACLFVGTGAAISASGNGDTPDPAAVAAHWNAERRAQAQPRDLVFDERGLAYLRLKGGALQPYGHDTPARAPSVRAVRTPTPAGKPGGGGTADTTKPQISAMDPGSGAEIGYEYTFSATVRDPESGLKSVSFVITYPDGRTQSFSAGTSGGDVWSVSFSGFSNGSWGWRVVAKDNGPKGGNTATSDLVPFTVDTGGGSTGGGDTGGGSGGSGSGTCDTAVANAEWTCGGAVQTAAGRIYFEMPANRKGTRWNGYVCSGTAVSDSSGSVSVILTAAHCVYDDANKAFARNVLFIPNQAATSGSGTDLNCSNDPLGCWAPTYGVVDADWASRSWPDNIPWDYAFYVVPTTGAHTGTGSNQSLESAAGTLPVSFSAPATGAFTHALGYSYDQDPNFMYCAEGLGTQGSANWWLSQCGLSGGSSGGPWIQPLSGGSGPVVSVNSWGYSGSPGMAGPKLSGTSASCLFGVAQGSTSPVDRGVIPSGC